MRKQLSLALLFVLVLALALAAAAQAQDQPSGSIRGTVYRDSNNDGLCVGTAEPALSGVPIRFTSGDTELFLQSGGDGSYGLVAAGLGTWQVTADPSAAQGVVTSARTRTVSLTAENPTATGVDFCVGTTAPANVVLPEAGAPAMPGLWLALLAGFVLVVAGTVLMARNRLARS